jgi:hypothetical protein
VSDTTTITQEVTSRVIQLASRYLAMALVATGSVSVEKSQPVAAIIAQYGVAVALLLFDQFIHSQRGAELLAKLKAQVQPWFGDISLPDLLKQVAANAATANQALSVATSAAIVANTAHAVATKADATASAVNQSVAPKVGAAGQSLT